MPVKILLADKSITIQKVVEMLFSGKEYEVTCVSDGDSAFSEATRIVPDVVLADVDLPRIDGYSFSGRLRETPALAKVPVILMLSRDDVYDAMKGKLAGLADNIAKPFESQELIGKVKKALSGTPPAAPATKPAADVAPPPKPAATPPTPPKAPVEPAPHQKPVVTPPPIQRPAAEPAAPLKPVAMPASAKPVTSEAAAAPKTPEVVPKDIFEIIEEAPADTGAKQASSPQAPETAAKAAESEEEMFEVEPEYEVEPEHEPGIEQPGPPAQRSAPEAIEASSERMVEEGTRREPAPVSPGQPPQEPQMAVDAFDTDKLFGREQLPADMAMPSAPVFEAEESPPMTEDIPTFDFSEPLPSEAEEALPLGQRAMDEMREGLGLGDDIVSAQDKHPDLVSFESLDMASRASHEDYMFAPPEPEIALPAAAPPSVVPAAPAAAPRATAPLRAPEATDEMLTGVAREAVEKVIREVLERVAWEIIPDLAERLIREEIERLKAEQP